jgi:hypothetical protein
MMRHYKPHWSLIGDFDRIYARKKLRQSGVLLLGVSYESGIYLIRTLKANTSPNCGVRFVPNHEV